MARKVTRILAGVLITSMTFIVVYLSFLAFPQLSFDYQYHQMNIKFYSDQELSNEWLIILDSVNHKIRKNEGFQSSRTYPVFFCHNPKLFGVISFFQPNAAGINNALISGNTFIRTPNFETNQIIDREGNPIIGNRTLTNTIAHEITHKILLEQVGHYTYVSANSWMVEGYCDYIGMDQPDLVEKDKLASLYKEDLITKLRDKYTLYRLATEYYLDSEGYSVKKLLRSHITQEEAIEAWIAFHEESPL